ncbi:hypothetical protein Tco_1086816, partial [Tanacetum coccineum]
ESNEKGDGQSHDERNFERKSSEQNLGGPPSYEDVVAGGRSPISNERPEDEESGEQTTSPQEEEMGPSLLSMQLKFDFVLDDV